MSKCVAAFLLITSCAFATAPRSAGATAMFMGLGDLLDLSGWMLNEARGIPDEGLTIVGSGTNPLMRAGILVCAGVRR